MFKNNQIRNLVRTIFGGFLVMQILFGYVGQVSVAQAAITDGPLSSNTSSSINVPEYSGVEDSIRQYLCAPSEDKDKDSLGTALFDCITKVYKFGIAFGAIALVFFVVLAGYFYITGGEQGKGKGKGILYSALTGMAVILASYVLLSFINPDLVKIKTIQTPIFDAADLPSCDEVGFQGNCVLPSGQIQVGNNGGTPVGEKGQCTAANLSQCSKWNVNEAIAVCNIESRGYNKAKSGTDLCDNIKGPDGDYLSFSYGIMQVSLKSMGSTFPQCAGILNYPEGAALRQDGNCPGGFTSAQNGTSYCKRRKCTAPKGEAVLNQCVNLLFDVANNVKASCTLYGQSCWAPWPDTGKVVPNYKKCPR